MPRHTIDVQYAEGIELPVSRAWLRSVANRALVRQRLSQPTEVGILITTDEEVQRLNRQYRGVDRITDVLSFSLDEGDAMFNPPPDGVRWLGEVVVSYPQAVRQAADYGHSIEREVAFLTVHGILHLLGHDHETPGEEADMMARQDDVLESLGITRDPVPRPLS